MSEPENPQQQPPPPPQYGAYPCNYPPPPPQQQGGFNYPPPASAPRNGLGIAALVVAIIALLSVYGGLILGIVAVILGFLGRGRVKRGEANNGGVAMAGIVLGFLAIVVSIVAVALTVWGFNEVGGGDLITCLREAGSDQVAQQDCADRFQRNLEDQFNVTLTPTP